MNIKKLKEVMKFKNVKRYFLPIILNTIPIGPITKFNNHRILLCPKKTLGTHNKIPIIKQRNERLLKVFLFKLSLSQNIILITTIRLNLNEKIRHNISGYYLFNEPHLF